MSAKLDVAIELIEGAIEPDHLLADLDGGQGICQEATIGVQEGDSAVASLLILWRLIHLQRDVVAKVGIEGISHELQAGARNRKTARIALLL